MSILIDKTQFLFMFKSFNLYYDYYANKSNRDLRFYLYIYYRFFLFKQVDTKFQNKNQMYILFIVENLI